MVRFSEDVHGLNDLKVGAARVIDHVVKTRRPTLITRRGRGVAVLVELSEYERMQDEVAFRRGVEEGARAADEGRLVPHARAVEILSTFGKPPARRKRR